MNKKFYHPKFNFIPDEQKILPSELKDVEFKIGLKLLFIPDEQKILPSGIIFDILDEHVQTYPSKHTIGFK